MKNLPNKSSNIGCFVLSACLILLFSYFVVKDYIRKKAFEEHGKYTIGVTFDKRFGSKGRSYIDYYFYFKGNKYEGFNDLKDSVIVPNGRYYVVFSERNPDINFIFLINLYLIVLK